MKPVLVLREAEFTSFSSYYLEEFWRQWFDIKFYDYTATYDRKRTIFAVWWANASGPYITSLRHNGFKTVVDNLWEKPKNTTSEYWIENNNWFWYNESLWWKSLGYDKILPSSQCKLLAFMPINLQKPERHKLLRKLNPLLPRMLWSYSNTALPGDLPKTDPLWQRHVNPDWYNKTFCSVVAETMYSGSPWLTEKTFKPIAFSHPFLVFAMPGALRYLKDLGFETFSHMWDESYDQNDNIDARLEIIFNNLKDIKNFIYVKETQDKLAYNKARFFDSDFIKQCIFQEIVTPLLNYVES